MIEELKDISRNAGQAIMDIYNDSVFSEVVDFKSDDSPLTLADKASHDVIVSGLKQAFPEIPVLSEEDDKSIEFAERSKWNSYWLVDPLDGTKEFIKRNGEFTVNIALIDNRNATVGVIYVPATETFYYGGEGEGAVKEIFGGTGESIRVNNRSEGRVAVRSRSHSSPEEDEIMTKYDVKDFISVGSSLKFCMVAEGKADLYYRHGPTMEWDTAAGQAILQGAGGVVYMGSTTDRIFRYNKEDLLNGSFLCLGFSH